jgi:hypothetical protein
MTDVDPHRWGIVKPGDTEPRSKTVAARVPREVHDAWTGAVEGIAGRTGVRKGDVAAIGMLIALARAEEWERLAAAVIASEVETGPTTT